jgi:hypothetical protein
MMFMSVFQAASILNIGSFIGVAIYYVLLLAALTKTLLLGRTKSRLHGNGTPQTALIVILFTLYAIFSAILFPFLFKGVFYLNPRMGFVEVPLSWETGHLNQLFYLLISVALFFVASYRTSKVELQQALDWYIAGNALASVIGLYQWVSLKTGIFFPSAFLHSNPVYGIFEAYEINGFARINSSFTEASAAAGSLTPALALVFWRLIYTPNRTDAVFACLIFAGLYLSISSTGYLCFAFLGSVSLILYLSNWSPSARLRAMKLMLGGAGLILGVALFAVPAVRQTASDLLDIVIFTKQSSFSYQQRSEWNIDAWRTGVETYGLGAGWGVCRASSLLPTLFGNVGIPGLALLALLMWRIFRPAWRTRKHALVIRGQVMLATAVMFVALFMAGPEFTSPCMWLLFAIATTTFPRSTTSVIYLPPNNAETPPTATGYSYPKAPTLHALY